MFFMLSGQSSTQASISAFLLTLREAPETSSFGITPFFTVKPQMHVAVEFWTLRATALFYAVIKYSIFILQVDMKTGTNWFS